MRKGTVGMYQQAGEGLQSARDGHGFPMHTPAGQLRTNTDNVIQHALGQIQWENRQALWCYAPIVQRLCDQPNTNILQRLAILISEAKTLLERWHGTKTPQQRALVLNLFV